MMTPSTKALLEYLQRGGEGVEPEQAPAEDPVQEIQTLQLQLKKKRYQQMMKQMMKDAGYGDIAGATTIGRSSYEVGGDEEEY
jgi:hypothetical protein